MLFTLNLFTWYFFGAPLGGVGSAMAMFSNLLQKYFAHIWSDLVVVTCSSVWRRFQGGGHSHRRGWCTLRPPPVRLPTPQTWRVAASPEQLPVIRINLYPERIRAPSMETHPDIPQVLVLLWILSVDISIRVLFRVRVGVVAVRVFAVGIFAA